MAQPRDAAAPGAAAIEAMLNEPLGAQAARLAAERAQYDAPIDPDNLPTSETIEAEIRLQPIGRTIAAICRDFGVVPGACTHAFWAAILEAITGFEADPAAWLPDMQCDPQPSLQEQEAEQVPAAVEPDRVAPLDVLQALGCKPGKRPVDPFRAMPILVASRPDIPPPKKCAAAAAEATGPPPRATMLLAA